MATVINADLAAFYDFLGQKMHLGAELSPEASVEAFRAHQREQERLRSEIQPALERFNRSEGRELDYERVKADVRRRLAEFGITD